MAAVASVSSVVLASVIVVRSQPVGDSDLIVSLLTPDQGKVEAFARSARNSRKRFAGGVLQPYRQLQVGIAAAKKGSLAQLLWAEPAGELLGHSPSYPQLCLAAYVTELAAHAAQPGHADAELYVWLARALATCGMTLDGDLPGLLVGSEAGFLRVVGQLPDLTRCARCGKSFVSRAHWPADGHGLGCEICAATTTEWVQAADLLALATAAAGNSPGATLAKLSAGQLADRVARLTRGAVQGHLRSAEALRDVLRV